VVSRPKAPPVKSQGIKTKLVPFILGSIRWDGEGRWIEPFVGSGAVLLNAAPRRALVSDANEHLIRVYQAIQCGQIAPESLREFLEREGAFLSREGERFYYEVRDRFNAKHSPFDFIFLNRACFNGMIRFNKTGAFNVPFCRKVDRFSRAYITKICNQVKWAARQMQGKDWTFLAQDWRETLAAARDGDFVYVDPPYIGRHTEYFSNWTTDDADQLAETLKQLPTGFAFSMWKRNRYRTNDHLLKHFADYPVITFEHFYHVGPTEALRNAVEEALVFAPGWVADEPWTTSSKHPTTQVPLPL